MIKKKEGIRAIQQYRVSEEGLGHDKVKICTLKNNGTKLKNKLELHWNPITNLKLHFSCPALICIILYHVLSLLFQIFANQWCIDFFSLYKRSYPYFLRSIFYKKNIFQKLQPSFIPTRTKLQFLCWKSESPLLLFGLKPCRQTNSFDWYRYRSMNGLMMVF